MKAYVTMEEECWMRSGFDGRAGCIANVTIDFQVVMDGIRELHAAEVAIEDASCGLRGLVAAKVESADIKKRADFLAAGEECKCAEKR